MAIQKRNNYISYVKGLALLGVLVVHLVEWTDLSLSGPMIYLNQVLYMAVFLFVVLAGTTVYMSTQKYDLHISVKKLFVRGVELVGIYYFYSIVKFVIFNFKTEPFFEAFMPEAWDIKSLVIMKSFDVPITIIWTIGILLIISCLFVLVCKKLPYPRTILLGILSVILALNYLFPLPVNAITDFIYARNNVTFPIMPWLAPFLIGFILAAYGFEKYRKLLFPMFSLLVMILYYYALWRGESPWPKDHLFPLRPYAMVFGLWVLYALTFILAWIEKVKNPLISDVLSLLRFWGDSTFSIYIYHWVVIDLTMWIFYPRIWAIWVTVPVFIYLYTALYETRSSARIRDWLERNHIV